MIDKKGKLFGKVNLIDLFIVLVIIAAVAYVGLRMTGFIGAKPEDKTQLRVTFDSYEAPDFVLDYIEEGTGVYDVKEMVTIGRIESFETGAPVGFVREDSEVEMLPPREGTYSVTLYFLTEAVLSEHGFVINGTTYAVGHTITIFAGEAKLYGKISGIEKLN